MIPDIPVYIIDDSAFGKKIMKQLIDEGFNNVVVFKSTAEFFAEIEYEPEVVIVNQNFKEMNAIRLIQRAKNVSAELYTILFSAEKRTDDSIYYDQRCLGLVDHILEKNTDGLHELVDVLMAEVVS